MGRRKHKKTALEALYSLNAVPRTEVQTGAPAQRFGLKQFTEAEQELQRAAEQREYEALMAPVRRAEAELTENYRKMTAQTAQALFTQPSEILAERCATSLMDESIIASLSNVDPASIRANIRGAFDAFRLELEGVKIEDSGVSKLYQVTQRNLNIDWRNPSSFRALYDYMTELGALDTDRDLTITRTAEHAAPEQPTQSLDETFNTVSGGTREGREILRDAILRDHQNGAREMFDKWTESLQRDFSGYYPTESEIRAVTSVMQNNGVNFLLPRSWHEGRLQAIRQGRFNPQIKYPQEVADELVDSADTNSYSGRAELRRKLALVRAQ